MLRIPLPEYDGFALREACKGLHVDSRLRRG